MQSVSENPLIAKFQLSSAASLNLGRSQNDILGNEFKGGLPQKLLSKFNFLSKSFRYTVSFVMVLNKQK